MLLYVLFKFLFRIGYLLTSGLGFINVRVKDCAESIETAPGAGGRFNCHD